MQRWNLVDSESSNPETKGNTKFELIARPNGRCFKGKTQGIATVWERDSRSGTIYHKTGNWSIKIPVRNFCPRRVNC